MDAESERLKAIFGRVVEKLKEVVVEFRITQDELHIAGNFLNRLGQASMCRSLVDVALAMTSVDATRAAGGTRPNLEGPFHRPAPVRGDGSILEHPPAPTASRLTLEGVVTDAASGAPVAGAKLDFWQSDNEGHYDREGPHLRGIIVADAMGRYRLHTVVPKDYSDHDHDPIGELFRAMGRHNRRAAHIHVKISVGDTEYLTTQLFIPNAPYLDSDYVEGAVSEELILRLEPAGPSAFNARFDFTLAGLAARAA